jgi:type 1 glutamine amidotransferase
VKSAIESAGVLLAVSLALLWATSSLAEPSTPAAQPVALRILILSGDGAEASRQSTAFLRRLLQDSGRFDVRVYESPAGLSMTTLAPFDVVVDDSPGALLGKETEKALEDFVSSGKGLVVTRGGLVTASTSSTWIKLAKSSRAMNPAASVDAPFHLFELRNAAPKHPVMAGLKNNWRTADQPLGGVTLSAGTELLATNEQSEALLFASNHGKGRVFGTALGHDVGAMQEKAFITTFLRGAEWAACGKVTLHTEIALPGPSTNGVRVLVITGGHDHEAAFYNLLEGYQDIGWPPVSDSALAFKQDIRAKYDVLVLYDFTRDLDDNGKKNLRDFVESGKGLVVLHHAILSFQKWPWWYEEVVGGLYRLESKDGIPNSTVKFGEEHWITAAGRHPITDGITPFHVTDETYKGLFISPNIKPLLFTDNPTSDRTVAWIGPCTTSKVVFIQLGHDHSPFRHPSYRALVHNSILWTADKLK